MDDESRNLLHTLSREMATQIADEIDGAGVLVATVDGFDLAHAGSRRFDAARLAAVASSFAALGDAASNETAIGAPRCLVIDSTEGRLVLRCMQPRGFPVVVVVLTDSSVLLGLVWTRLRALEQSLPK